MRSPSGRCRPGCGALARVTRPASTNRTPCSRPMRSNSGAAESWRTVAARPITRTPIAHQVSGDRVRHVLPERRAQGGPALVTERQQGGRASVHDLRIDTHRGGDGIPMPCGAARIRGRAAGQLPLVNDQRRPARMPLRAGRGWTCVELGPCPPSDVARCDGRRIGCWTRSDLSPTASQSTRNARTRYGMFFMCCSPRSSKVACSR